MKRCVYAVALLIFVYPQQMTQKMRSEKTASAHWPPPLTRLPHWENLVNRISVRKTSHMSIQLQLTLTDYTGNTTHLSLSQQPLVGHKVRPARAKDSPKRSGTKGMKSPSQILGQSPSLASIDKTGSTKDLKTRTFVLPHRYQQRHTPLSSESMTPQARPRRPLTSDSQPAET